jgi:hypothetical protein
VFFAHFTIRIALVKKNVLFTHMADKFDSLLGPLAQLMVAQGIGFPELAERLKGHYVAAAMGQLDGKQTDSKLSVMTGLQRRDVARLRAFERKPPKPHPLTRLVALWQTHPDYSDHGTPRALARSGPIGSFDSLAREVRQDIHPRTLLDGLHEAGMVEGEDPITLIKRAYTPPGGSEEQVSYLSENAGDHLLAAVENIHAQQPPHFERALHYTGLTEEGVAQLKQAFEQAQMTLLTDLYAEAARLKAKAPAGSPHRIRLGGYAYSSKDSSE